MPGRQNQTYDIANHYDLVSNYNVAALGTTNSADQVNPTGRGLKLGVNITVIAGTAPTLTVVIQGKDESSGQYYTLLSSAALAAVAFTLYTVYPGLVAAANVVASDVLPNTWRVQFIAGGTAVTSIIATIGASVLT